MIWVVDVNRETYVIEIVRHLSAVAAEVGNRCSLNLTDIAIHCENLFKDLLNAVYEFDLVNVNAKTINAPAIDLGDDARRISVQVTANSNLSKVKKTIQAHVDHELHRKYDRLIVLNIGKSTNHKPQKIRVHDGHYFCTKEDVWDVGSILRDIAVLPLARLESVHKIVMKNVAKDVQKTTANEVQTFFRIIEVMSDATISESKGAEFKEEPDPEGKISNRFAEHGDFLKAEYLIARGDYNDGLLRVKADSDIGAVRERRLAQYLRTTSDRILTEAKGDARAALEQLVAMLAGLIAEAGVVHDHGAIRFYVLDQLIACNVFPNKEEWLAATVLQG